MEIVFTLVGELLNNIHNEMVIVGYNKVGQRLEEELRFLNYGLYQIYIPKEEASVEGRPFKQTIDMAYLKYLVEEKTRT